MVDLAWRVLLKWKQSGARRLRSLIGLITEVGMVWMSNVERNLIPNWELESAGSWLILHRTLLELGYNSSIPIDIN